MQFSTLERAIVEAKYEEAKSKFIFQRTPLFNDLVAKANGEFIDSFFEGMKKITLIQSLFMNKQRSRPFYSSEVFEKIVEMGIAPTPEDAEKFKNELANLVGEKKIPIILGYSKDFYYSFKIVRRPRVEDIYFAVRY